MPAVCVHAGINKKSTNIVAYITYHTSHKSVGQMNLYPLVAASQEPQKDALALREALSDQKGSTQKENWKEKPRKGSGVPTGSVWDWHGLKAAGQLRQQKQKKTEM